VKEKCVALEVASAVKNVGVHSKNYGKLRTASNKIKTLTDDMARKAQEATHFSDTATELKYKVRGGYITELHYDKTGEYKFTDLLKIREVINQKKKEIEELPQKIRDLRKKQKGTVLGEIRDTQVRQRKTDEEIEKMKSGANIAEALGEGLKSWVQQELHLKEQTMQAQTVLNKAMAKHEAIEKINPENLEDEE
jgi:Xaa-Pro aminopeptidase